MLKICCLGGASAPSLAPARSCRCINMREGYCRVTSSRHSVEVNSYALLRHRGPHPNLLPYPVRLQLRQSDTAGPPIVCQSLNRLVRPHRQLHPVRRRTSQSEALRIQPPFNPPRTLKAVRRQLKFPNQVRPGGILCSILTFLSPRRRAVGLHHPANRKAATQ